MVRGISAAETLRSKADRSFREMRPRRGLKTAIAAMTIAAVSACANPHATTASPENPASLPPPVAAPQSTTSPDSYPSPSVSSTPETTPTPKRSAKPIEVTCDKSALGVTKDNKFLLTPFAEVGAKAYDPHSVYTVALVANERSANKLYASLGVHAMAVPIQNDTYQIGLFVANVSAAPAEAWPKTTADMIAGFPQLYDSDPDGRFVQICGLYKVIGGRATEIE